MRYTCIYSELDSMHKYTGDVQTIKFKEQTLYKLTCFHLSFGMSKLSICGEIDRRTVVERCRPAGNWSHYYGVAWVRFGTPAGCQGIPLCDDWSPRASSRHRYRGRRSDIMKLWFSATSLHRSHHARVWLVHACILLCRPPLPTINSMLLV